MIDFMSDCQDALSSADAAAGRLQTAVDDVQTYVTDDTWQGGGADDWVSWWNGQKAAITGVVDDLPAERQVCYAEARRRQAEWNQQQAEARRAQQANEPI